MRDASYQCIAAMGALQIEDRTRQQADQQYLTDVFPLKYGNPQHMEKKGQSQK